MRAGLSEHGAHPDVAEERLKFLFPLTKLSIEVEIGATVAWFVFLCTLYDGNLVEVLVLLIFHLIFLNLTLVHFALFFDTVKLDFQLGLQPLNLILSVLI